MKLKEYHRKRRFRETPEPIGKVSRRKGRPIFVVQKHAASHLHYDFRLEHDGTLKSWAIPRGPSLDPGDKTLAVEVEDHPIDYAAFEGTIPKGEYGGGTVMVWDRGTWEAEGDAARGLKQGKLTLQLFGEKLRGGWSLVRMRSKPSDRRPSWLLIKRRDNAARPGSRDSFLTRHARSVLSGKGMDEIAAPSREKPWTGRRQPASNGIAPQRGSRPADRRSGLPRQFKPQLAVLTSKPPVGEGWVHELKLDGYRILAFVDRRAVRLISRNGRDWTRRFPSVAAALEKLHLEASILDGEVVALDVEGKPDFQTLQGCLKRQDDRSLVYYLFDAPFLRGRDLTQQPLLDRKSALVKAVFPGVSPRKAREEGVLRYSDHVSGQGSVVFDEACRSGLEGIVSKKADGKYLQFRTPSWLKVKCSMRQEFVIGGFTRPSSSRVGFGALLLGHQRGGRLIYAGRVGTGFSGSSLESLKSELKKRVRDSSPFAEELTPSQRRGVTWSKPDLVAEIEFKEWTRDGLLRHPSFKGLREDKSPGEIVKEAPRRIPAPGARKASSGSESKVAGVRISHPGRLVYPGTAIHKIELARYYETIAPWILPHVAGRPLSILRCQRDIAGSCFYQKHWADSMPSSVQGKVIAEKEHHGKYIVIEDAEGLLSLVQLGAVEMHPWQSTVRQLERPDRIVLDLDPAEDAAWTSVVRAAREIRSRLERLDLQSFLRTSGGKGLHVVVPIGRRAGWELAKDFSRALADSLVRDDPDRYIATASKARRRGKVFIDYLRNQRGATAIASYSARAREKAPISAPISWEALESRIRPDSYTIRRLPPQVSSPMADPWAAFFDTGQELTAAMVRALRS